MLRLLQVWGYNFEKNQLICLIFALCFVTYSFAEKTKMKVVAQFNAGQPNASFFKMYDASDDVIC